jgi:hypothetical protein
VNRPASRNTYLVMTQQVPNRTFELVEATTIAEAAQQGIVMLLVRSGQQAT